MQVLNTIDILMFATWTVPCRLICCCCVLLFCVFVVCCCCCCCFVGVLLLLFCCRRCCFCWWRIENNNSYQISQDRRLYQYPSKHHTNSSYFVSQIMRYLWLISGTKMNSYMDVREMMGWGVGWKSHILWTFSPKEEKGGRSA